VIVQVGYKETPELVDEHRRLRDLEARGRLKFYGWQETIRVPGSKRMGARVIAAAASRVDLVRRMNSLYRAGYKGPHNLFNLSETGNTLEVALLQHSPAIAFVRGDEVGPSPYFPMEVKDGD